MVEVKDTEEEKTKTNDNKDDQKSTQQKLEEELQHYQKDTRVFYNVDTNCKVI